ncbi:serine/threonine-protein kinase PRP4 [Marchantia polymorpha subsp. ruderalis]
MDPSENTDLAMEEEVEESRVDMEVVDNGWDGGLAKVSAGTLGDVEDDAEILEAKKSKESRESRRKRKEREAAGDVVEDAGVREERKKRRDERDKRRGKDLDDHERHRENRDKKDVKRKKGKENKERKERREERHGSDREIRVQEDSKDLDLRDRETFDRRERRERKLDRKDSVDDESHVREIRDRDGVRAGTSDRTHSRNDDVKASSHPKPAVVDDEQEEGEILDEDSCPAKDLESGEICMGEEADNRDGVRNEAAATVIKAQGKADKSRWDSPPLETLSSVEESKIDHRERVAGKSDRTSKSSPNALQSMLGIAEAYDSESQASDEKPVVSADLRSGKFYIAKESENGARSEGPDLERNPGFDKKRAGDKFESKKHSMGPPEQRGSESKDRKYSKSGESRSRHDGSKLKSSQSLEAGHSNHADTESPSDLSLIASSKSKHARHSLSPAAEDAAHASGKRGNGGRRRRSPSPENINITSKDRQRRGRSPSKDSANHRHSERGRSRSLESAKDREVLPKRIPSAEIARSHVRGRSRSRDGVRDRRTGVDGHDRKKRSWSPDSSYERRHSKDNQDHLDRNRRSKSRESARLKPASRADSVDRKRRSRSRESLREKRVSTEWESGRRAESMERRRRSRSRESSHRRGEERDVSRHGDGTERRRGSRDVPRDYKGEDRDASRHEWRADDGLYRNSRDDRSYRDGRHFENNRENMYKMDRERDWNANNTNDRTRGHKTSHFKDSQHSNKDSLADSTMEEENQEEYQERVASQLAAQEEDDPEKIKVESRLRRQAILEKYQRQEQQKSAEEPATNDMQGTNTTDVKKQHVDQSNGSTTDAGGPARIESGSLNAELSLGKGTLQNGALPQETTLDGGLGAGSPKSERSADMFCDDIFGESPAGGRRLGKGDGLALDTSGLTDNWDDAEGYYCFRIGEMLDGRYEVASSHGRGVFSTVVRARDLKAGRGEPEEVAIKIIRNNETMFKAGQQELVILKKLAGADPENKRHCVRLLSSFEYRSHLCLVFESLHMNLREILKKFGRNIGINLNAVRVYAKQLFIALKHLKNCGVLHCDIKPDNMLVNEAKNVLKLCDFGSAMFAGENEITPYLVSRFYRAPEIILGLPYDHALDIWSVGCCLYELYTGKMLFPGHTNNDMLRLHMELKGPFPKKMLKKAAFADQHFDQDFNFCAIEEDPVTKKTIKRILVNVRPKDMGILVNSSGSIDEDSKLHASFKDLLEKIFILDPDKRLTVSQALNHSFISGK